MQAATSNERWGGWMTLSPSGRLGCLGVAVGCAAILGLAAYLKPDPHGLGTHMQIYGAPCSFLLTSGLPCPTCGMTTAFALMMHGHPLLSLKAQPTGAILCLATILALSGSVYAAISGRMPRLNWERIGPVRVMLLLGFLILGGWGFKLAYGLATGELPMK